MNGFKTLIWNAILVAGGAVLPWAANINWTDYISPTGATIVVAAVNVALRMLTNGPMLGGPAK